MVDWYRAHMGVLRFPFYTHSTGDGRTMEEGTSTGTGTGNRFSRKNTPYWSRAYMYTVRIVQFVSYSFFFVLLELLEFTVAPKALTHQANLFNLHIVSETHRTMGLQTLRRFQHQRSEQNHHSPDANQLNTTQPLAPP
jgi:hypothetical protein